MLIEDELMMSGVDRKAPIVMDIEDKVTALAEPYNDQSKLNCILRGMTSIIGECSNCASSFHNKQPKTPETKLQYSKYVDLLSIVNGKAIDYRKTGVLYNIPRHIAKYSKPLPYFMKYASPYYAKLHKFAMTHSNMNRLCLEIEKWEKTFKYKRTYKDFDYRIMYDDTIDFDEDKFSQIEEIYKEFCREMAEIGKEAAMFRKYNYYKDELKDWVDKATAENFIFDYNYYYDKYRKMCYEICPNKRELANYATILCYEKYPARNKKFLWQMAGEGVVENIKPVDIMLPVKDDSGDYTYLGKKYSLVRYNEGEEIDKRKVRDSAIPERGEYRQEELAESLLSSAEVLQGSWDE